MKRWFDIEGPFSHPNGTSLQGLAAGKIVLEIGSWKGRSTVCLAEVALHVYACDPHNCANTQSQGPEYASLQEFQENTEGYTNITLLLGTSEEVVPPLEDNLVDLVFIDGCHNYPAVKQDIELALPKLKSDGTMTFHDWGWNGAKDGGPTKAIVEMFNNVRHHGAGLVSAFKADAK